MPPCIGVALIFMDEKTLRAALKDLPLRQVRYFQQVGSTNDEALAWAAAGAGDLCLVYAEEQTSGRGRMGRTWFTPPGSALACSLVLRPGGLERENVGRFTGLGALALVAALKKYNLAAQVKWPNDVLIRGRKVAGILAETVWMGAEPDRVVLGIGVNVSPESVPPSEVLHFPATCVQLESALPVERYQLLHDLLAGVISWRSRLTAPEFVQAWDEALAFRGEMVQVWVGQAEALTGEVAGLDVDGSLQLKLPGGQVKNLPAGEIHLRPL